MPFKLIYIVISLQGVNILGSSLFGAVYGLTTPNPCGKSKKKSNTLVSSMRKTLQEKNPRAKLLLTTGFCGAFTTFSTFSVDIVTLILDKQQYNKAATLFLGSNIISFSAAYAAVRFTRAL